MKKAFTLIELLVVIAIIALLTSIVLAATTAARLKARDATRMDDLHQLSVSLESYFNENGGTYPSTSGQWQGICPDYNPGGALGRSGPNGWIPNLAPANIPILPIELHPVGTYGCYLYRSDGHDYKLLAHQTVEYCSSPTFIPSTSGLYDPQRSNQCTFQVSTPGAANW